MIPRWDTHPHPKSGAQFWRLISSQQKSADGALALTRNPYGFVWTQGIPKSHGFNHNFRCYGRILPCFPHVSPCFHWSLKKTHFRQGADLQPNISKQFVMYLSSPQAPKGKEVSHLAKRRPPRHLGPGSSVKTSYPTIVKDYLHHRQIEFVGFVSFILTYHLFSKRMITMFMNHLLSWCVNLLQYGYVSNLQPGEPQMNWSFKQDPQSQVGL